MANQSMLKSLAAAKAGDPQALAELKALRKAQKECSLRVEELKLRLLLLTEKHWDQSVSILKNWLNDPRNTTE